MSLHIAKFIDRVRAFESRNQKDFTMPLSDAKSLHADITQLLLQLNTLQQAQRAVPNEEVISIEIDGGKFNN